MKFHGNLELGLTIVDTTREPDTKLKG